MDQDNSQSDRYCWVCFATDEDDEAEENVGGEKQTLAQWVQPCQCKGTTRWVHQSCLSRWIDEKQKGNSFRRVQCPQCQTEYLIVFPSMGTLANVLEGVDTLIRRVSPFLTAGLIFGSLYWTAVTYGAVTVLQVVGYEEGLQLMESCDSFVLLFALPAIPVGLVLGRMIRWEDVILRLIQSREGRRPFKLPLFSLIVPMPEENDDNDQGQQREPHNQLSEPLSVPRVLCGALLLPSISSLVGHAFFDSIQNNLHRTLIGGLTFIVVKGALKIYFKQKQYRRKRQRRILDYTAENVQRYGSREQRRGQTGAGESAPSFSD